MQLKETLMYKSVENEKYWETKRHYMQQKCKNINQSAIGEQVRRVSC